MNHLLVAALLMSSAYASGHFNQQPYGSSNFHNGKSASLEKVLVQAKKDIKELSRNFSSTQQYKTWNQVYGEWENKFIKAHSKYKNLSLEIQNINAEIKKEFDQKADAKVEELVKQARKEIVVLLKEKDCDQKFFTEWRNKFIACNEEGINYERVKKLEKKINTIFEEEKEKSKESPALKKLLDQAKEEIKELSRNFSSNTTKKTWIQVYGE